ncbi:HNH endonuclease, partial [Terrabacter sp. GCM10028922]|uniref:HNH endonuclease signature motif containing protein n=1 Tax=Terrabacter sp. GCM10028922 TaxID=3273428 RepID=UPI00360617B8
ALDGDVLDPRRCVTDGGPPRITWADALTLLATRSLDTAATDTPARRSRYRVQVHLDTDGGWLTGRPRLPQHIVDGLTCDGQLTPVWETDGHPVNVGRTHRVVPHRTRILVLDRDRGCRYPACRTGPRAHLEIHHLTHWRDGGPTDLTNLLGLCPFHHDGHHRGDFTITGDPTRPDGLRFHTRHGLLIGPPQPPPLRRSAGQPQRRPAEHAPATATPDTGPAPGPVSLGPGHRQRAQRRPRPRLGRHYPAPTGAPLHLRLVDFTPPRATPLRR